MGLPKKHPLLKWVWFTGNDRGSNKHIRITEDGTYRIDFFCNRKNGESDYEYKERALSYGKVKTTGRYYVC